MAAAAGLRVTGTVGPRTGLALVSGGRERSAVLCLPHGELPRSPTALVLDLHGSGSTPREQLARSRFAALGERDGVLVVAPRGGLPSGAGHTWHVPYVPAPAGSGATTGDAPDDEQFLLDLVGALVNRGWVDASRVCAAGMSGGARMVSQLACDHPERLAAIAAVAGLRAGPPDPGDPYRPDASRGAPRGAVPVVAFHGTADTVNPYPGGGPAYWGYSPPAALARWAEANRCPREALEDEVGENVRALVYGRNRAEADVLLYVVEGGGHTWPGSSGGGVAAEGPEIDASEVIWDFFRRRIAS